MQSTNTTTAAATAAKTINALTVNAGRAGFKTIEDDLKSFYEEIGCRLIDITTRKINGKYYDIICDDEGLFCDDPIVTAVNGDGAPRLVGGLIICGGADDEGNLTSLEAEDVLRLTNAVQFTIQQDKLQPVLILDE